jgi:hypothetical protein
VEPDKTDAVMAAGGYVTEYIKVRAGVALVAVFVILAVSMLKCHV